MTRRYAYAVLVLAALGNFSQLGARLLLSPVVPDVVADFGVSKAAVGLALTGMWATYALLQYPSGVLADRFGERRLLLAALAFTGLACLLVAASPGFLAFGLFVMVLGAGAGLYYSVAAALLARLFRNTGQVLGVLAAGGSFAGLVAPVAAAVVAVRFGWRTAPLLGAAVAFPAFVLVAWRVRPRSEEPTTDGAAANRSTDDPAPNGGDPDADSLLAQFRPATVRELLGRRDVAFTTAIAVVTMFTFQSFSSFFPTFLIEHRAFTTGEASLAFGAVFVLSTVMLPLVGRLSDALPRDLVLGSSLLVAAAGFVLFLAGGDVAATVASVAVLGVGFSWGGVLQGRFMDRLPAGREGPGFGLVRTAYMLVGSTGSAVTGALADGPGWAAAFGLVAALLLVAVLAMAANRALGLGL